jgi:hypothetical protein
MRELVDASYRVFERGSDVLIRFFVEADMTVADLDEAETAAHLHAPVCVLPEQSGGQNTTLHRPQNARACPRHALQKSTPVHTVFV